MKYLGLLIALLVMTSCSNHPANYSGNLEGRSCGNSDDCMPHYYCSPPGVQGTKTCVWDGGYFRR